MKSAAWNDLESHFQQVRNLHLRQLFAADDQRGKRMTAEAAGIYLDYSKNRITDQTIKLLLRLASPTSGLRASQLPRRVSAAGCVLEAPKRSMPAK